MALALTVLVASLVLVRLRLDENGHPGRTGAPGGRRAMTGTAPPDVLTATTASPQPHRAAPGAAAPSGTAAPDGQPSTPDGRDATTGPSTGRPSVTGRPGTTRPAGAVLGLSATRVDLGAVDSTWRLNLRAEGTAPVDVVVGKTPSWLAVVPDRKRVDPGTSIPLMITLNRASAPTGTVDVSVPVAAGNGTGGADVRITAQVDGSPRIASVTASPARIVRAGCPTAGAATPAAPARSETGSDAGGGGGAGGTGAPASPSAAAPGNTDTTTVTVTANDETGIQSARLTGTLPDGRALDQPLTLGPASGDRTSWTAVLLAQDTGTIAYTATVTSLTGRTATSSGTVTVLPCPA
ncbi:BACON domain-containing protein [Frankia sp. AiPs1]|uniref:hypothetical protein n=1 Tax=Frankia sp. AiPa1 TaxID=573492 RepID=UPI00202B30DE|nr:hypothetical protein [Frankia sp. AiPa1]MCL9762712.1 hypothetical protein [Frankia sp. AiPa1]